KHVTIGSDDAPYSKDERKIVQGEIDRIYELFLEVVGRARGMTRNQLHPIAAGRVWTGRQALDRKLVDEMGGVEAAIRKARSLAGLSEDAPAREVRRPRRMIPPRTPEGATGYVVWLLESLAMLNRAPALAVMEYLAPRD